MNDREGFTLIELIIVITIIGILVGYMGPVVFGLPSRSRDTVRIENLRQIRDALILMDAENNPLPANDGCIDDEFFGDYQAGNIPQDPGWKTGNDPLEYSGQKECDGQYWYEADPGDTGNYTFGLFAIVENWKIANTICPPAIDDGTLAHPKSVPPGQDKCFADLFKKS
jgi:prepilin-type N-terminal cleavage/methylation domain-containing protein